MRTVAGMLGGYTKVSVDGDTEYGATESAQFDYAIVVDKSERGRAQMDEIRLRCAAAGLEASAIFESVQCDELYLLLRVGASTLSATCAAEGSPIQCDERALAAMCADMPARFPGAGVGPVVVPDDRDETPRAPFEFIYAPFSARPEYAELWRAKDDSLTPGGPFGSALRLKTLVLLLERPPSLGGCGFSLSALRARGFTLYPLHGSDAQRARLHAIWAGSLLRLALGSGLQPLFEIKDYFGEQIALYFAFLGHGARQMLKLGVVGALCEGVVVGYRNTEAPAVGLFAVAVALWAVFFTETWKRRESSLQLEWGMSDFEETQPARPQFLMVARRKRSAVDGSWRYYFPRAHKTRRVVISWLAIAVVVALVLGVYVATYALKVSMLRRPGPFFAQYGVTTFSLVISVEISIINVAYTGLASALTAAENHRTATEHTDSLIAKLFLVQFINSYASLYYTAFAMKPLEGSCDGYARCMDDLCNLVATIMAERFAFTMLFDNYLPRAMAYKRFLEETKGVDPARFSAPEKDYILDKFDPEMELVNRYMDQARFSQRGGAGLACVCVCVFVERGTAR